MQRLVFPTTHAHPQLEALKPIQPADTFLIDWPAFTAEQDPDAQEPEARTSSRIRRRRAVWSLARLFRYQPARHHLPDGLVCGQGSSRAHSPPGDPGRP